LHLCFWNIKKFCKTSIGTPIKFLIIQKKKKNEKDMKLKLQRGLGKVEKNYHSSFGVTPLLLTFKEHL